MFLAVIDRIDHQQQGDQDARDDARGKQVADRLARSKTVHDKGNAGRNDDAQASGHGNDGDTEFLFISQTQENGKCHAADSRHSGDAGAGNRPVEEAGDDDRAGKACRPLADQIGKQIEKTAGNAALGHQDTGQDEHGHCQHGKAVQRVEHGPDNIGRARCKGRVKGTGQNTGRRKRHGNRHCQKQQNRKQDHYKCSRHSDFPPFVFFLFFASPDHADPGDKLLKQTDLTQGK